MVSLRERWERRADRQSKGYWATVGAVALGSGTAGVVGIIVGFLYGLLVLASIATVLERSGSSWETAINTGSSLMLVIIGVPCMALGTAFSTYHLVEKRTDPGWDPPPKYEAGRLTLVFATVLNSIVFAVIALVSEQALFMLMARIWLWPLYVVPVAVIARAGVLLVAKRQQPES